jgi:Domain of unknown function (DUF4232)
MHLPARIPRWPVGLAVTVACAAALIPATLGATSASARTAAAATPTCSTADLSVWVNADQESGAAGTLAYPLEFTNIGKKACTLRGYPGVSATNAMGKQLGNAAARSTLYAPSTVTVGAGGTVHAVLFYAAVEVSTSGCKPVAASFLKVYPPNQKTARTGFFSLPVCTLTGHVYLRVTVVRPGVLP